MAVPNLTFSETRFLEQHDSGRYDRVAERSTEAPAKPNESIRRQYHDDQLEDYFKDRARCQDADAVQKGGTREPRSSLEDIAKPIARSRFSYTSQSAANASQLGDLAVGDSRDMFSQDQRRQQPIYMAQLDISEQQRHRQNSKTGTAEGHKSQSVRTEEAESKEAINSQRQSADHPFDFTPLRVDDWLYFEEPMAQTRPSNNDFNEEIKRRKQLINAVEARHRDCTPPSPRAPQYKSWGAYSGAQYRARDEPSTTLQRDSSPFCLMLQRCAKALGQTEQEDQRSRDGQYTWIIEDPIDSHIATNDRSWSHPRQAGTPALSILPSAQDMDYDNANVAANVLWSARSPGLTLSPGLQGWHEPHSRREMPPSIFDPLTDGDWSNKEIYDNLFVPSVEHVGVENLHDRVSDRDKSADEDEWKDFWKRNPLY